MKFYIAGPLFTDGERSFNEKVAKALEERNIKTFLPQRDCPKPDPFDPSVIAKACKDGVDECTHMIAILDGADADSGTCFEMGRADAQDKTIIGLRTDFRGTGDDGGLNLMLSQTVVHLCSSVEELVDIVVEVHIAAYLDEA